jgi:hypothetical protein
VYRSGKSNRSVVEVNAESRQSSKPDKPDVETHRVLMAFAAALTGDSGGNIDTSQRRALRSDGTTAAERVPSVRPMTTLARGNEPHLSLA